MPPYDIAPVLITIALAVLGSVLWYLNHSSLLRERKEIRDGYTDLVREKLDLIRTALTMGYEDAEIKQLDTRLEQLIGTQKMMETLGSAKKTEAAKARLEDKDLESQADQGKVGRKEKTTE